MVRWRSLVAGGAVSAVAIVLLLRSVDLARTGEAFARASPGWLALAVLFIAGALFMRVWKWQLLFLPDDRVSLWGACSASLIGYMFNTILPGRVGELARASLVSQTERVSVARAVGTIFIEKILDILTLLLMLAAVMLAMPLPDWITTAGLTATLAFGLLGAAFFAMSAVRGPFVAWLARRIDPLPLLGRMRPSRMADLLLGSARCLGRPRLLALQVFTSAALWTFAWLTAAAILRAFHVDAPWTAVTLLIVTTNLGMTVPSAPGYVGVYHYIAVLTLGLFSVDAAHALGAAVMLHALGFGLFTLAGAALLLLGLAQQRYSLAGLRGEAAAAPAIATQAKQPVATGAAAPR
jgi:uncharacterized membrane protein YbhN (UPF0104 family)